MPATSLGELLQFSCLQRHILSVICRADSRVDYNLIRGECVLDFAAPGHRGKKLVPRDVVRRIEEWNMRVFR